LLTPGDLPRPDRPRRDPLPPLADRLRYPGLARRQRQRDARAAGGAARVPGKTQELDGARESVRGWVWQWLGGSGNVAVAVGKK
jgi:hypothetical protein